MPTLKIVFSSVPVSLVLEKWLSAETVTRHSPYNTHHESLHKG